MSENDVPDEVQRDKFVDDDPAGLIIHRPPADTPDEEGEG